MEGRIYEVSFAATSETVAVDFFELITGSTGAIEIVGIDISQTNKVGDANENMLGWYIKRATGSYTSGSGGSTGVARSPINPGDAAATFTAETLNTTQVAAGTGTLTTIHQSAFNIRQGLQWVPPPELTVRAAISSALVIGLTGAPAAATTFIGSVLVAELFP